MRLDAIIAAGGDPERDSELLKYAGMAPCKALIELDGISFLDRIIAALLDSGRIHRIVVVGLSLVHHRDWGTEVVLLPDAGGMLENAESGLEYLRSTGDVSERVLTLSCDLPLLTPSIVTDFIEQCLAYDVDYCYSIVSQDTMERAFPGSGRTFIPLADGRFAGGDLSIVKSDIVVRNRTAIHELIGQRKSFWRQLRVIGLRTVVLFLVRRLTVAMVERRAAHIVGITGKAIFCPHAEVAMDVDKPHHLDVVRAALARRKSS